MAFEGYRERADLFENHLVSQSMSLFQKKVAQIMVGVPEVSQYEDAGGFLGNVDLKKCGVFCDTRITAASGERGELMKGLENVAKWVKKYEKDTYTYLIMRSLDDEDGIGIFECYANKKAALTHQNGHFLVNFLTASKDMIKDMEVREYAPNGHGWLYR
jgi:quinol monooxygenase YgiN